MSSFPPGKSKTIPKTENPFSKTDLYPIEIQAEFDIGCQDTILYGNYDKTLRLRPPLLGVLDLRGGLGKFTSDVM